jgi:hypothetical protein
VAHIGFGDLACGYSSLHRNAALLFSASPCGNYVLVAEGGMIFVYELFRDSLRVTASILGPRRVLAMSVDISHGHIAVAALLVGRLGLMCNLATISRKSAKPADGVEPFSGLNGRRTSVSVSTIGKCNS